MQQTRNSVKICTHDNKKTTRVPVLSHQTTRVKTYHLSAKRKGDEFFTEGGLMTENSTWWFSIYYEFENIKLLSTTHF